MKSQEKSVIYFVISHDFKTIFVHIPKTGGTSVESMFGLVQTWEHKRKRFKEMQEKGKHWGIEEMVENYPLYLNSYFKWTIVRNPWERDLSLYNMMKGQLKYRHLTFKEYLKNVIQFHLELKKDNFKNLVFQNQIKYITKGDHIAVNDIVRYENIDAGWERVCKKIKKPHETLRHLRRANKKPIDHYYDQECIDLVAKMRKEDIEFLNYDYSEAR